MQNPDSVLPPEPITATEVKDNYKAWVDTGPKIQLDPFQELHIRKMLAGMSPIELLFLAARANPKSRFNMHHNAPNAGMGRHIVARKERAYHRRRKAQLKAKST